jgi:hypothetical protein
VYARPPEVDSDCHVACATRASALLTCAAIDTTINHGAVGGTAGAQARFRNLIPALRANLGAVIQVGGEASLAVANQVASYGDAVAGFLGTMSPTHAGAACLLDALMVANDFSRTFAACDTAVSDVLFAVWTVGRATS